MDQPQVPQELNIVPERRVGEYPCLDREPQRWGFVDVKTLWADTAYWLDVFKLHHHVSPVTRMRTSPVKLLTPTSTK